MSGEITVGKVAAWTNLLGREYVFRTSLPHERVCRVFDQRLDEVVPEGYRHLRTTYGREHGKGGKYGFTYKCYWANTKFPQVKVTDYAELVEDTRLQILGWWDGESSPEGSELWGSNAR